MNEPMLDSLNRDLNFRHRQEELAEMAAQANAEAMSLPVADVIAAYSDDILRDAEEMDSVLDQILDNPDLKELLALFAMHPSHAASVLQSEVLNIVTKKAFSKANDNFGKYVPDCFNKDLDPAEKLLHKWIGK